MTKTGVGLVSGIALVVLTLIIVALTNLPEAEGAVSAAPSPVANCPLVAVAQDQGYGLTRTVARRICSSTLGK